MQKIVVTKESNQYRACLEAHPEIWGWGKTYCEALGNLVRSYPERFCVEVVCEHE